MARELLIVDDEADIRVLIRGILEDEGYQVREAANAEGALEAIANRCPSLVILDIWLQGSALDGMELLEVLGEAYPELPVVMISGHGNIETAVAAIHKGAVDFIEKPFKADHLLLVLRRAIEASRLKKENTELRARAGAEINLLGQSTAIQQLRHAISRVAPTNSRVLVTGPAGAGKEVVARNLHMASRRSDGPFIILNCAAMHPDRLEKELFGTMDREAAKSNGAARIGTLEKAHGGTLLLDEVADMPLETQGKIVRMLHENCFERLGEGRKIEVDVRVIAATNRDLVAEMQAGNFRQDLFYRLSVVPLRVPGLAERREDIPLFIEHFVEQAVRVNGLPARKLSDEVIATLQAYEWPGNVRQLRNVIESLLIMAPGGASDVITADMVPTDIGSLAPGVNYEDSAEIMSLPLRDARELFERRYLEVQMTRFSGNISRTAAFIGMERSALHRKLRLLGISTLPERPVKD